MITGRHCPGRYTPAFPCLGGRGAGKRRPAPDHPLFSKTPPRRDKDSMSFCFDRNLVVPVTDRARVLLVQDDQSWALPHFAFTEDHFGIVGHVNQAIQERLGLTVTVLRCLPY